MKDKSTQSLIGFVVNCIIDSLIGMIWYIGFLFRSLPDTTYRESKIFLWVVLAVFILVEAFLLFRYRRTGWTIMVSLLLPYGFYTVLAYTQTARTLITVTLTTAGILTVLYTIFLMTRRMEQKKSWKKVLKRRLYQCLFMGQSLVAIGMAIIMLFLGSGTIFGHSSIKATTGEAAQEQTIANNMDTILLLQEDKWEQLTVKERLNVMQTVANIEAHFLGLPNELNVRASNLREHLLARYSDSTHTIYINLDHLENDPVYAVLNSCCHEAYHSYQRRLVDVYNETDKKFQNLRIYDKAISYAQEFSNYENGYNNPSSYYYQDCEQDSREYAEEAVEEYYSRISAYLDTTEEDEGN